MTPRELHHTLSQAALAAWPPPGCGLTVTELELAMPLELSVTPDHEGAPIAVGGAPFTRWLSGVLPELHRSELRIELIEDEPGLLVHHALTRRDGP